MYAQIWEDPQSALEALALQPGARLLTISSGGCNAMAYLSALPAAVHTVDLNQAHLSMLALKRAAFARLPDHDQLLAFLGDAAQPENDDRYRRIAPALDEHTRAYWDGFGPAGAAALQTVLAPCLPARAAGPLHRLLALPGLVARR